VTSETSLEGYPLDVLLKPITDSSVTDLGVVPGVVISELWLSAMGTPSTLIVGTITVLYDVGATLVAIGAAFTTDPPGRKRALILGAGILLVGAIIMGLVFERIQFMVARVITGVGIGYITSVTPVYQSESSASSQRGWQVCCQLTIMLFGLILAYWINYGVNSHRSGFQWRFSLLFQAVFAISILAIALWMPDAPRWLMGHDGNEERGLVVLTKLRGLKAENDIVQREKDDIVEAIIMKSKGGNMGRLIPRQWHRGR
jgi:MFS family permease